MFTRNSLESHQNSTIFLPEYRIGAPEKKGNNHNPAFPHTWEFGNPGLSVCTGSEGRLRAPVRCHGPDSFRHTDLTLRFFRVRVSARGLEDTAARILSVKGDLPFGANSPWPRQVGTGSFYTVPCAGAMTHNFSLYLLCTTRRSQSTLSDPQSMRVLFH